MYWWLSLMRSVLIEPWQLLEKIATKGLLSVIIMTSGPPIRYWQKCLNPKSMARASKSSWGSWLYTNIVNLLENATGLPLAMVLPWSNVADKPVLWTSTYRNLGCCCCCWKNVSSVLLCKAFLRSSNSSWWHFFQQKYTFFFVNSVSQIECLLW